MLWSGFADKNIRTGAAALLAACFMLGLGYAAVPLYNMFCAVTGFGGTTQRASESEAQLAAREGAAIGAVPMSIRFDASVDNTIPWTFKPAQITQDVTLGQRSLAYFTARNDSAIPIKGVASFNVTPQQVGKYFNKIQCFCFTEQTLKPGEEVRMPVLFYVDPAMLDDENTKDIEQITLSYTFHKALNQGDKPQT